MAKHPDFRTPLGIRLDVIAMLVAVVLSALAVVFGFLAEEGGHP